MSSPPSLPAAVEAHARRAGEEPWLFHPDGLDWRWVPWRHAAVWAGGWGAALAGRPAGSRFPFPYVPWPRSVALDLGAQWAGLLAEPRSAAGAGEAGEPELPARRPPVAEIDRRTEGGAVADGRELSQAELLDLAEGVQAALAPPRKAGEREIVVLGGPLESLAERAMLSWATLTGAAVVLEPTPDARIATAAWVRPTVFHGTAGEVDALRPWAETKWRRRRLPFGRLRTILVAGGGEVADPAFWTERGVRVAPLLAAERRNRGI